MPASFTATFERTSDDRLRLWAKGELDAAAEPVLSEAIESCVLTRPAELVVDLGGVTFKDSSGLRVLLHGPRIATKIGVPLVLREVPEQVRRVLDLTGTSELFDGETDWPA